MNKNNDYKKIISLIKKYTNSSKYTTEDLITVLNKENPDLIPKLNEIYNKETSNIKNNIKNKKTFWCPVLNIEITKTCHLEKCPLHIDYKWSNNCILSYLNNNKSNRSHLNFREISFLLDINYKKTLKIYNKAFNKIRKDTNLLLIILNDNEYLNKYKKKFEYIETDKVCCVCESKIDKPKKNLSINNTELCYCCKDCKKEKPYNHILIEKEVGIPYKEYIALINKIYNKSTVKKILSHIKRSAKGKI